MTPLALMRCLVAAFLLLLVTRTWSDPDLWGHIRFGGDIVASGRLALLDPYSFTSDIPWTNHEWLSEVLTYLSYAAGGNFGLIALKTVVVAATLIVVAIALQRAGLDSAVHDLLIFLVFAGTFARTHVVRPQVFSLLLFAILVLAIIRVEQGKHRFLWAVPTVFAAWANLHGGWIVGLAVFLFWCVLRSRLFPFGVAAVAATLLNPYGWGLWRFVAETVRFERAEISDWQPIWSLPALAVVPWLATALLATYVIARRWRTLNLGAAAIPACSGLASALVGRLDMFFVVSTVMLLGPALGSRDSTETQAGNKRFALAASAVVASVLALVAVVPSMRCVQMDGTWQPEPEVVTVVKQHGLRGRMLTFFDWGQYAIWHLSPDIQVSMDGRRETVYSHSVIQDHLRIYRNDPGADRIVEGLNADAVWLPNGFGILRGLEGQGWTAIFRGEASTLLVRRGEDPPAILHGARTARCFPGP